MVLRTEPNVMAAKTGGAKFAAPSDGVLIEMHIAAYNVPFNALNGVLERLIMHKYSIY